MAGYPFFGHFDPKVFKYRVCEDTFYPDDETKQKEWVALIVHAVEQWDTATNGFIKITPEYKPPEEWEVTGEPDFEECTEPPSWW